MQNLMRTAHQSGRPIAKDFPGRLLLLCLALILPRPSFAFDGTIDVTDTHQSARGDTGTFDTFSRRDAYSVGQRLPLSSHLFLDLRVRRLRELSGSEASGQRVETERITNQPSFLLNYDQTGLRLGLTGGWQERTVTADVGGGSDQEQYQFGATLDADPTRTTDLNANWGHSVIERPDAAGRSETREYTGVLRLRQKLARSYDVGYRYSARSSNLLQQDTRQVFQSHLVEFSGTPTRGAFTSNFRARSQLFRQEVETGSAGLSRVLLVPQNASLTLDDTPDVLDPLEGDPEPVLGLFDGDLDGSTVINVGDSASPVREFGGDYRNIQLDFGEEQEIAGAALYVDRQILLPELFEWHVFVTDDPEGRTWTEVSRAEANVVYEEFGDLRQGWSVSFQTPRNTRHFKLVDVKLGQTLPNLFVTELEVYREDRTEVAKTIDDSQNHRFDATLGYQLTKNLRLGSQTTLRRRSFDESSKDLDEMTQSVSSHWAKGSFLLTGRLGIQRLWSDTRRNTDLVDYSIAARQKWLDDELVATLTWNQSEDQSSDLNRTTASVSMTTRWNPTGRLQVSQRLSRGTRDDEEYLDKSTSMLASTTLRGRPITALTIYLTRTDRWVDREAGTGFEQFRDTSLSANWNPLPLISLSSYVTYQQRDESDWLLRNSLGWSPLPGGRAEFRLSGNTFSDTRTDNTRYSSEASVRWAVRPRVTVDASVESARVKLSGKTTTPIGTSVHLRWSF